MKLLLAEIALATLAVAQNPLSGEFSTRLPTDADLPPMSPACSTSLTSSVNASSLSLTVQSTACFLQYQLITIGSSSPYETSQICSIVDGTHLTLCSGTRGYSQTTAASHASGQLVAAGFSAFHQNATAAWLKDIATALGANLANVLKVGDPTSAGSIDLYPPNDTTHPIGWQAPATRSTQVRLVLPSADPSGQVLTCATPSGSPPVSACTWTSAGGSMTYPSGTGIAQVSSGASWGTTLSLVTTVGGTGSDTSVPTEQAVREAITAVETGVHGDIDIPAGSMDSGSAVVTGMWKFGSNGLAPLVYGGVSYYGIKTTASAEYFRADFRLPSTWTGSGVTVKMATIDVDGNSRSISYTAAIGCTANGDNVYNTQEPTYGSTATLSGTQASNGLTELSASLSSIPAACTAGAQARLKIIRGSFTGNHGVYDVSLVW